MIESHLRHRCIGTRLRHGGTGKRRITAGRTMRLHHEARGTDGARCHITIPTRVVELCLPHEALGLEITHPDELTIGLRRIRLGFQQILRRARQIDLAQLAKLRLLLAETRP